MTILGKTIVGLLIIGGVSGAVYYMSSSPKEEVVTVAENSTTTPSVPAEGKKMAFSQFMKSNTGSYKCTVNQYVQNMETKGTVYINSGMIKGEFATTVAGQNITSNFIVRDGFSYTWSSAMPTMGFKVKVVEPTTGATGSAEASGTYAFNGDQIGDYNCEDWQASDAMFTVPTSVTFKAL